jgi:hypothetical protein
MANDLPPLFHDVARWYAATTVALGIRTGLVDALLSGCGTTAELATAAGVDAGNAKRWASTARRAGRSRRHRASGPPGGQATAEPAPAQAFAALPSGAVSWGAEPVSLSYSAAAFRDWM